MPLWEGQLLHSAQLLGWGGGLFRAVLGTLPSVFPIWWQSGDVALLAQGNQPESGKEHLEPYRDLGESSR